MKIGELARATATKVETIRFYERIGLLPEPARTDGNYRDYGPDQLARLSFVRRARDLGFTLDQVRELAQSQRLDADPPKAMPGSGDVNPDASARSARTSSADGFSLPSRISRSCQASATRAVYSVGFIRRSAS